MPKILLFALWNILKLYGSLNVRMNSLNIEKRRKIGPFFINFCEILAVVKSNFQIGINLKAQCY